MQSTRVPVLPDERPQPSVDDSTLPPGLPLFFGTAGRPLAGWYHAVGQNLTPRTGVVICAPFGYEMMCVYRASRHLAEQLAANGAPTIRFDYDGTGDSAGSDHDPARVAAWIDSIGLAIDELKMRSGVTDVVLFGLRFGALLSAAYAQRHPVSGLVLMAPIASGRAFVRELRALEVINGGAASSDTGERDTLGYHLSDDTRADLTRIDLTRLETAPAAHALVIGRDDLPAGEQPLVTALQRVGVVVTSTVTGDFADMVVAPHKALVPFQLWDEVVRWVQQVPLQEQPLSVFPAAKTASVSAPAQLAIVETPHGAVRETFVSDGAVFGVLCRPAEPTAAGTVAPFRAPLPTVLLLNIGMNHHVGCHRLWVTASRLWATRGYQVLRLDSSGIGDSATGDMSAERALYSGQATEDLRRVMDVLEKTQGAKRFLLCGLCAGAFMAYHTAVVDSRVVGTVMINLRAFEWRDGDTLDEYQRNTFTSAEFYRRAAMAPRSWKRLANGDLHASVIAKKMVRRFGVRTRTALSRLWVASRGASTGPTVLDNMRTLCRRGTDVLMIFGTDEPGIDLMEDQLGGRASRMRKEPLFRVATIDGADHTFTGRAQREELLAMLDEHLRRRLS
ncbi:MAG: alpha/beta hydrolase [Vicinamibacterales bacterium]